ncbi:MAG: hypothetical protein JWQ81_7467 [Amycolatopsis sp.]|jgi:hypothetical protein|uniref:DUF6176 family protein n=1 Tax=Amycolatopsis sp. TaxID=37632 RepID=UPI0026037DA3|nr:DUF6176 family protein [Amycolatopsis sp.]MCU1686728.1 hypothetical protein [Amycolatopsis sp.]
MKFRCIRMRLHPGQRERAVEWMHGFGERADTAVPAMRQNGLRHEVVFLESDGQNDYLLMVQASDDFDATSRSFLHSNLPIDREALQVLGEIGERGSELPVLVELHVDE